MFSRFWRWGWRCRQAGHGVTFCAAESYAPLVRETGLSYARGGRELETLIRERGESLGDLRRGPRQSCMVLDEQLELVRPACQGADILVGTSVLLMGPSIAAGLRIPLLHGLHSELLADRELPPPFGFPLWRRPWLNRLLRRLMGSAANLMTRRHINRLRAQLSLPAVADVYTTCRNRRCYSPPDPAVGHRPPTSTTLALPDRILVPGTDRAATCRGGGLPGRRSAAHLHRLWQHGQR